MCVGGDSNGEDIPCSSLSSPMPLVLVVVVAIVACIMLHSISVLFLLVSSFLASWYLIPHPLHAQVGKQEWR